MDDPSGTVRATADTLAVRAPSADSESNDLSWFLIDIGHGGPDYSDMDHEDITALILTWPIVYQPA